MKERELYSPCLRHRATKAHAILLSFQRSAQGCMFCHMQICAPMSMLMESSVVSRCEILILRFFLEKVTQIHDGSGFRHLRRRLSV